MKENIVESLRLSRGWTQQELASHSGLHIRTIQRAEHGNSISIETAKCLGATFDIDYSLILKNISQREKKICNFKTNPVRRFIILSSIFLILNIFSNAVNLTSSYWCVWVIFIWGVFIIEKIIRTSISIK